MHVKTYLVKVCAILIEDWVIIVSASHWAEVGIEYVRASSVEKRLQVNLRESDLFSIYLTQILVCLFRSLFDPIFDPSQPATLHWCLLNSLPDPVWHGVRWHGWDNQTPLDNRSQDAAMVVSLNHFIESMFGLLGFNITDLNFDLLYYWLLLFHRQIIDYLYLFKTEANEICLERYPTQHTCMMTNWSDDPSMCVHFCKTFIYYHQIWAIFDKSSTFGHIINFLVKVLFC